MFAVEMYGINKSFGGSKIANDSIDFKVHKGEIHALVGENGAGKSTLMKILYGMYPPDSGKILVNEKEELIHSPADAIALGIGMVHQHFMLVNPMTVLENIILGDETTKTFGILNFSESEKRIKAITENFNIKIDLRSKIENLPVGTQQKVEILKILYRNADILILDEPTAVLTPRETDELFKTLKDLKSKGKTIILITHKMNEVLSVSDNITVLRNGKISGTAETKLISREELTDHIVGHKIVTETKSHVPISSEPVLLVKNLSVYNDKKLEAVKNASFNINGGEILGIAGVEGNGQTELAEALTGIRKYTGEVKIKGNGKAAHIPADRHRDGVIMEFNISENMLLGRQNEKSFSSPFKFNKNNINQYSEKLVDDYDIRPGDTKQLIQELSGGNQQKVVVARELSKNADLIVVSHPARGLDIKATGFVHHSLLNEREKGKAILLISSDLSELMHLSDRIAVMFNGEITVIFNTAETNEKEIGLYMTGVD